jgi:hypothetical protein
MFGLQNLGLGFLTVWMHSFTCFGAAKNSGVMLETLQFRRMKEGSLDEDKLPRKNDIVLRRSRGF